MIIDGTRIEKIFKTKLIRTESKELEWEYPGRLNGIDPRLQLLF